MQENQTHMNLTLKTIQGLNHSAQIFRHPSDQSHAENMSLKSKPKKTEQRSQKGRTWNGDWKKVETLPLMMSQQSFMLLWSDTSAKVKTLPSPPPIVCSLQLSSTMYVTEAGNDKREKRYKEMGLLWNSSQDTENKTAG